MDDTKRPLLPNGSVGGSSAKTTTKSPQKQLPAADPPSEHIPAAVEPATKQIPAADPPPEQIPGADKLAEEQVPTASKKQLPTVATQRDAQGVSQEPRERRGAASSKHSSCPNYSSSSSPSSSSSSGTSSQRSHSTGSEGAPERRRSQPLQVVRAKDLPTPQRRRSRSSSPRAERGSRKTSGAARETKNPANRRCNANAKVNPRARPRGHNPLQSLSEAQWT